MTGDDVGGIAVHVGARVAGLARANEVLVSSTVKDLVAGSGLRFGDRIVDVDGKDSRDWSSDEVSKNVRGERSKPVQMKVERAGEEVEYEAPHGPLRVAIVTVE